MLLAVKKNNKIVKVFGVDDKPFQAEKKAKDWIAEEENRNPNFTYKLLVLHIDITELMAKLEKDNLLTEINWKWDNKRFNELLDYDQDIT